MCDSRQATLLLSFIYACWCHSMEPRDRNGTPMMGMEPQVWKWNPKDANGTPSIEMEPPPLRTGSSSTSLLR